MNTYKIRQVNTTKFYIDEYTENMDSINSRVIAGFNTHEDAQNYMISLRWLQEIKKKLDSGELQEDSLPELPF